MDIGPINHEVEFCRVHDNATREKVERILLRNGISYYIEWEDRGLAGFFMRRPKEKTTCIFRIHSDEVSRAKELLRPVLGSRSRKK